MKHYVVLSSLLAVVIVAILGAQIYSQKKMTKLDAFHESLKFESSQNYQKSIQSLQAIYSEHKDDVLVNLRLGWLNYLTGNYEESKRFYSTSFALSGNKSIDALLGQTLSLSAMNNWDAVAATYSTILKLDPMNYTANLRLGQIMLNRGLYADAKTYLEKAYSHYPASYEPNLSLGWTYYYLGDRKKATSRLTDALMLSPGDTLATKGLNLLK